MLNTGTVSFLRWLRFKPARVSWLTREIELCPSASFCLDDETPIASRLFLRVLRDETKASLRAYALLWGFQKWNYLPLVFHLGLTFHLMKDFQPGINLFLSPLDRAWRRSLLFRRGKWANSCRRISSCNYATSTHILSRFPLSWCLRISSLGIIFLSSVSECFTDLRLRLWKLLFTCLRCNSRSSSFVSLVQSFSRFVIPVSYTVCLKISL